MDREQNGYLLNHDLPHENTLDNLGLEIGDLNANLRAKIRRVDDLFQKAMADGYIDDEEERQLITESYKVAEEIQSEYDNSQNRSGDTLGIIGGIFLLVGAAIGIKQLTK